MVKAKACESKDENTGISAIYMETPDGDYFTGYDLRALLHPQALLVTEMMGAPLTQFHGAPLRLHMPTKYGYKQIKRIGLIAYTNVQQVSLPFKHDEELLSDSIHLPEPRPSRPLSAPTSRLCWRAIVLQSGRR